MIIIFEPQYIQKARLLTFGIMTTMNLKDFKKAVARAKELIRYLEEKPPDTPFLSVIPEQLEMEKKAQRAEERRLARPRSRKRKKS